METIPIGSPVRRSSVRAIHVVVFALAVLALMGAGVFALMSTSSRDDAARARHVAERQLSDQRSDTRIAQRRLSTRQLAARMEGSAIRDPLASADTLAGLGAEGVDAARNMQAVGADPAATAERYNATVERANDIIDRYNGLVEDLQKKFEESPVGRGRVA
jgi:hypothetical protein